jgi:hypothetical protein
VEDFGEAVLFTNDGSVVEKECHRVFNPSEDNSDDESSSVVFIDEGNTKNKVILAGSLTGF